MSPSPVSSPQPGPFAQTQYQVRFDWGLDGVRAVAADADVVVLVDVLSFSTRVELALSGGADEVASGTVPSTTGAAIADALAAHPGVVVAGSLRNAAAVARWILARQDERGERFVIAIIGAGEGWADGSTRFAVEDLLGAGSIIEELAALGLDYCSPEAATAGAAFAGLRNATKHLITASGSGRELIERGEGDFVSLATQRNGSELVPVLREFGFRA